MYAARTDVAQAATNANGSDLGFKAELDALIKTKLGGLGYEL
jgi:hypothetical protein